MNYNKIYDQIIERARIARRKKYKGEYFEEHHITPISLGGDNSKENRVLLTAREHFICHKLLVFIYPYHRGLFNALWMMMNIKLDGRDYKISSREYELCRIEVSKMCSERFSGDKNPNRINKPKPISDELRKHYSVTRKGFLNVMFGVRGVNNAWWGKHHSKESKDKSRNSRLVTIPIICPWCLRSGDPGNFKQWHFDNCKLNPNRIDKNVCCIGCHKIGPPNYINGKHLNHCKNKKE